MCNPEAWAAASMVASGVTAYQQSKATNAAADYNQTMAEYAAQDAERRGEEEAQRIQRNARQMKGAQRAAFAGRGLDLTTGSVAQAIDETDFFGAQDAATARTNARNEAWGNRAWGRNQPRSNTALAVGASLLGGAANVADKWYAGRPPAPKAGQ